MNLYDDYPKWVETNIEALENIEPYKLSICSIPCKDIKLANVIAQGGGSYIVKTSCNNHTFAVKLYNGNILGNLATRENYKEIIMLLKYSLLKYNKICNNFLPCYGYGIGCCIVTPDFLNMILKEPDVLDYVSMQQEEGCETFALTDLLDGHDLTTTQELNDRQVFEYVYGLLCSLYYFGVVPSDRHLDNVMLVKNIPITIEIGKYTLEFKEPISLIHIDYQAMTSDYSNILGIIRNLIDNNLYIKLKKLLELGSFEQMILGLPFVFDKYIINKPGELKWIPL